MFRTFLVLLFLLLFFIFSIPALLVETIIGLFSKNTRARIACFVVRYLFKVILFLSGTHYTVKGLDNIPDNQAVLYVGNHNSYFDIILSGAVIPTSIRYVSKKEIKKVPIINLWMYYMNCLFIDRADVRQGLQTINKGAELVKNGWSIFIFPEGTRSKTGEMAAFKEGSFKIAQKSGCPVVPVAFTNTSSILEKHFPKIKSANVTIEFGRPICIDELPKDQKKKLGALSQEAIQKMIDETVK